MRSAASATSATPSYAEASSAWLTAFGLALSSTGAATFGGTLTVSGGIKGTTTNDNASAGNVGEYIESVVTGGSAVTLTTATAANITSISLTAGDWDVDAQVAYLAGAVTGTIFNGSVSTTSATEGTFPSKVMGVTAPTGSNDVMLPRIHMRKSLSGTTTIYLVAYSQFTAGTVKAYGIISARRVR